MTTPRFTIGFAYDKATAHPFVPDATGHFVPMGYDRRPLGADGFPIPLRGIVLHSTEGAAGSTWEHELTYIRDSPIVSAHYYVGRAGQIERVLDPGPWRAWHAGLSLYQGWRNWNDFSVGIEFHHSADGSDYPPVQLQAGAWLCAQLRADHPTITQIVLHRWIAIDAHGNYGRKIDPTSRNDRWWSRWIANLAGGGSAP